MPASADGSSADARSYSDARGLELSECGRRAPWPGRQADRPWRRSRRSACVR